MTFYGDLAVIARDLLNEFGQTITVTRKNIGIHNPVTGLTSAAPDTNFTAYGAIFNYEQKNIDGLTIMAGDKLCTMEATNEPLINDVVTTTSGNFNIISVIKTAPSGEAVIYDVQLRS